ncbi:MAG: DUF1565 domain-containing protein [Chloroflexi bacterium]|nr:DUF1565 domain-containing protein [Chloroflexota bacterium]
MTKLRFLALAAAMLIGLACASVPGRFNLTPAATAAPKGPIVYLPLISADIHEPPQADYYVSVSGDDDENDGRSPATAFRTLERAMEVVQPGQTVLILSGTYHEFVEVYELGAADAPIVIRGDTSAGGRPVFDGQERLGSAFQCWWCTNIIISDLAIRNYRWEGVGIFLSRDVTLRDLRIRHTGFGIHADMEEGGSGITVVESRNVLVEGNILEETGMRIVEKELSGYGIDVWGCQDCLIKDNTVRKVMGTGILVEESCNVTVESNVVEESEMQMLDWWDGGIWLDGGREITVRDNVFRNNHGPGIQVSDTEVAYPRGSRGFVLENNISQGNEFGLYVWNFGVCPPPEQALRMSGNVLKENRQHDFLCVEWACGVGQPCVPPSDEPPPC